MILGPHVLQDLIQNIYRGRIIPRSYVTNRNINLLPLIRFALAYVGELVDDFLTIFQNNLLISGALRLFNAATSLHGGPHDACTFNIRWSHWCWDSWSRSWSWCRCRRWCHNNCFMMNDITVSIIHDGFILNDIPVGLIHSPTNAIQILSHAVSSCNITMIMITQIAGNLRYRTSRLRVRNNNFHPVLSGCTLILQRIRIRSDR
mmetsp:Transcript_15995/g.24923  ORF Transcript_15995/g.24923 Transcript_15995/m.24923 type:complete len:204 (-) Transcript_15995:1254-1865(-)